MVIAFQVLGLIILIIGECEKTTDDYWDDQYDKWLSEQTGAVHVGTPPEPPALSEEVFQRISVIEKILEGANKGESFRCSISRKGEIFDNLGRPMKSEYWREQIESKECPEWRCSKYHQHVMFHRLAYRGYWCPNCSFQMVCGKRHRTRCTRCRKKSGKWTRGTKAYWKLDLLRQEEGRPNLKMVTFSHEDWNVKIPAEMAWVSQSVADQLKTKGLKKFRNWRTRNKYWLSREAKGQGYPEWTLKPVWNGWGFDEVQIHFHIHAVVCSKKIENQDIQVDLSTLKNIPMSTTIQRNWGGIVDVRECKTWQHSDGTKRTSKKFVMGYLVNYINKLEGWRSFKFGF